MPQSPPPPSDSGDVRASRTTGADDDVSATEMTAWMAGIEAAAAEDPPRAWARLERHTRLWTLGREYFLHAARGQSLAPLEQAMALSYVNSRAPDDAFADVMATTDLSLASAYLDDTGLIGRTFGDDSSHRLRNGLDRITGSLRAVLAPVNRLRGALNRAPIRIIYLGRMPLGDFVLTVGTIVLGAVLASSFGLIGGESAPISSPSKEAISAGYNAAYPDLLWMSAGPTTGSQTWHFDVSDDGRHWDCHYVADLNTHPLSNPAFACDPAS